MSSGGIQGSSSSGISMSSGGIQGNNKKYCGGITVGYSGTSNRGIFRQFGVGQ